MLIDFNNMEEVTTEHMNGGDGCIHSKMFVNENGKVIVSRIPPDSSIGLHMQNGSNDINFIVIGEGIAICDGKEEKLSAGVCHYCPDGHEHSIVNTGKEDLIFYTVVHNVVTE